MKKIFIFVFSVVMIFNLSAKEHNFSIGMDFGSLNGQAQEIVYMNTISDNKLSELLWNFKTLNYIGLDLKYSWLKPGNILGFFVNGSFKIAVSDGADIMEDKDWLSYELTGLNRPNWLTNYSVHDSKVDSANLIDLNLGMSFLIYQKFLLRSYISYHNMYFSWSARGGSLLYPKLDLDGDGVIDWDHSYLSSLIKVISYEQTWHIFSPAISFYGEFNRYFDIELAFEITPFIWCVAVDEHILRDLVITDSLKGGTFIEPSILFSYKPSEHFILSFSFAYREIKDSRGDAKYKYTGQTASIEKNLSGAGYTATDIGIIAKYKF
ncbi:omptin family outer membrane protease [Treponema sp. R6D11]